jgi:hypothetical protein
MKKLFLLIFLSFFVSQTTKAQTVDEIINNYLEAIGGKEKLSKIKALHIKGSTKVQGMDIPVEIYMTADGKQIVFYEFQGKKMVQLAFDGETAWSTNFMSMKNEKLDSEMTENIKRTSKDEFPNSFLNYKEKGFKAELIGKEEIEGVETYKVKLTQKTTLVEGKEVANEQYYYFDTENFVPVVVETEIKQGQFKGQKAQQVFSDYQEVDGIYFSFSQTSKFNGMTGSEVKLDTIVVNPDIDENIFKFKETN